MTLKNFPILVSPGTCTASPDLNLDVENHVNKGPDLPYLTGKKLIYVRFMDL